MPDDKNIPDMTPEELAENIKKAFRGFIWPSTLCKSCAHREVCKMAESEPDKCEHFLNSGNYKIYGNIYNMFQPIFDWLQYHYPHGEVRFVVDNTRAQMWQEHGPIAHSKELTDILNHAAPISTDEKSAPG